MGILRDLVGLTGAKYGCGMAQCGACTVHLDGKAVRFEARTGWVYAAVRCGRLPSSR